MKRRITALILTLLLLFGLSFLFDSFGTVRILPIVGSISLLSLK